MDNNFQKRVQTIRKLEEKSEEILNLKKEKKEIVKKRQSKEFERFYKYVQKEFISYILDIFEKYTTKYGRIKSIEFRCTSRDFRIPRGTDLGGGLIIHNFNWALDTSKTQYFFYLDLELAHPTLHPTEPHLTYSVKTDLEAYTIFYKDYKPRENFAHVFFPDNDCYNKAHFSVDYPNIVLGIDGKSDLINAVSIGCEYKRECLGRKIYNINDLLEIEYYYDNYNLPFEIRLLC